MRIGLWTFCRGRHDPRELARRTCDPAELVSGRVGRGSIHLAAGFPERSEEYTVRNPAAVLKAEEVREVVRFAVRDWRQAAGRPAEMVNGLEEQV